MSRRLDTDAPQDQLRILFAASLADSTSRITALEAEESARRARRRFLMGQLTEEALAERLAQLAKARRAAADAAFWRRHCELKFDPDQPRDDHGRWTSGGGGGAKPSSHQREIAAALRSVIATTGEITPNTYLTMRNSGLRLGDILGPGIYQVEFTPQIAPLANLPLLGTAHSQFVFVDSAGNSHILSGGPGGYNSLQLSIITGNFDGEGAHSLGSIIGQRSETISINNVKLSSGQSPQDIWENMNNLAEQIGASKINYNATDENSNSLFYTIAKYNNIGVDTSRVIAHVVGFLRLRGV